MITDFFLTSFIIHGLVLVASVSVESVDHFDDKIADF